MRDAVEMLFVYGTLKPGQRNYPPIAEHVRAIQTATIPGALVDRGRSPGLIEEEGMIEGVLLSITAAGLAISDEIEDYRPGQKDSLYIRRRATATLDNGDTAPCWTYYFGDPQSVADQPRCVVGRRREVVIHAWPHKPPKPK